MSVLAVDNVKFKYPLRDKFAVDGVSFQIEKGSYTAIVGLNGSGKSTLARLICGLDLPQSGSVTIEKDLKIGMVFQSPKNQIVSSIVIRDTAFGPQNLGIKKGEIELRTIECLNLVDMLYKAKSSTAALSLGQTQKIALSGILAISPEILVLDEAISMLDPESRHDILMFLRYWHKCGNTIIHITHDIECVEEVDNVIGMESGKVFFYGTKNAFFSDEQNVMRIKGESIPCVDKSLLRTKAEAGKAEVSLSARNLNFRYNNFSEKNQIRDLNFDLYKGSLTALTGPSGAGKSTILELLCGLLECGENQIKAISRPVLAQQNASAALFEPFAADDVAFGPRNKGVCGAPLKELVKKSMDCAALPFEEFAERNTFALSGGEQRRLSIAGILALDSDIVLFDEPTAALDSYSRNQILKMMRSLADEGKTVLFSTHKREEAEFADREIVIDNGMIVSDSCVASVITVKNDLKEFSQHSAAGILKGLRNANSSVSGEAKEKPSVIEKLPAFLRVLLFLALFTVSLVVRPLSLCAILFVVSAVYCVLCGFKLKNLLRSCLKILPFLLFFTVLQLIFHPALQNEIHFTTWKYLTITPSKIFFCLASILRTYASLACICGFFVSTPEYDLIDGLKILLKPLSLIKIPVRYFILIIEIVFRFIPLLIDEALCIIKTQIIRGGLGDVKGKMKKIKSLVPLVVPLIIQTIKRSESLADAITMRYFK